MTPENLANRILVVAATMIALSSPALGGSSESTRDAELTSSSAREHVQRRVDEMNARAFGRAKAAEMARPRIVGGSLAGPDSNPFQVGLLVKSQADNSVFCGGSLVRRRFVVTAAHCSDFVRADQVQVLTGTRTLAGPGVRRDVVRITIHPGWNPANFDNDIAVWELASNADGVPLAKLARGEPAAGTLLLATGWGDTEAFGFPIDLMEVKIPLVSNATCNAPASYGGRVTDNMICAGLSRGGIDTCQGDSGGPLSAKRHGKYKILVGITSWGDGCADPNAYGVYTRVSRYRTFINRIVSPTSCSASETVYVQGEDKRLWRERGCQHDRDWVDDSVGSFQATGGEVSYVLGADSSVKRLWRVRGNMHNREWVDDSVGAFQAINDNLVYVLGADPSVKRLWRIRGNMHNREWVDDSVGAFQAINDNLVYVLGADSSVKRLWRIRGNMHNREWVDDSVGAFQAIDDQTVYILGADPSVKRLWRVRGNMHNREWVADGVEAFQAIDANRVLVLRENGDLWNILGTWGSDAKSVDQSVARFQFPGLMSPTFANWHRPWNEWPRVTAGGGMVCGPWCAAPAIVTLGCPPLTWGAPVNPGRPSTVTARDPEGDLQSITVTRTGGPSSFTSQVITQFAQDDAGNSTAYFYPTCDCPGGSCPSNGSALSFVAHATDAAGGSSSVSFVCGCYP